MEYLYKNIFLSAIVFFFAVSLFSCTRDLETFDSQPAIYFTAAGASSTIAAANTADMPFNYYAVEDTVINVCVSIAGKPADYDRKYVVSVDPTSTAVSERDYVLPNNFVIKAGQLTDTISVKVNRTVPMRTEQLSLILNLSTNDNFNTNWQTRYQAGYQLSVIQFKITMSDFVTMPTAWGDKFNPDGSRKSPDVNFGYWSVTKMVMFCAFVGIQPQYLNKTTSNFSGITANEANAWAKSFQRYLNEQTLLGNIILDEDGTPMKMGTNAQ